MNYFVNNLNYKIEIPQTEKIKKLTKKLKQIKFPRISRDFWRFLIRAMILIPRRIKTATLNQKKLSFESIAKQFNLSIFTFQLIIHRFQAWKFLELCDPR